VYFRRVGVSVAAAALRVVNRCCDERRFRGGKRRSGALEVSARVGGGWGLEAARSDCTGVDAPRSSSGHADGLATRARAGHRNDSGPRAGNGRE